MYGSHPCATPRTIVWRLLPRGSAGRQAMPDKKKPICRGRIRRPDDPANAPSKDSGRRATGTDLPIRIGRRDRRRSVIIYGNADRQIQAGERYQDPTGTVISSKITFETSILNSWRGSWPPLTLQNSSMTVTRKQASTGSAYGRKAARLSICSPQSGILGLRASSRYGSSESSSVSIY